MLLVLKDAEHFKNTMQKMNCIRDMLNQQGKNNGESRYLEIMTELTLLIEKRLAALFALLCLLIGLCLALLIALLLIGG